MKLYLRALLASLLILFIAACSNQTEPENTLNSVFEFTIDPTNQSVNFESQAVFQTLAESSLQCGLEDPQTLIPETDLKLTSYDFSFLPNNELKITAKFQNPSTNDYLNLNFEETGSSNIISSTEPLPTQALFASEETAELEFLVQHKGRGFSYFVEAKARVVCEVQGEADLEVTKVADKDSIMLEEPVSYTITLKNIGTEVATSVQLVDVITASAGYTFAQPQLISVNGDAFALNQPEKPCAFKDSVVCNLGDIQPNEEIIIIYGTTARAEETDIDVTAITVGTLTNTVDVSTNSPESNLDNNMASTTTDILIEEPTTGNIIIEKQTLPDGDATSFAFTGNVLMDNAFSLADGETQEFKDVPADVYSITELATDGWSLTDISCDEPHSTGDINTGTATIKVTAGETVTCVFTNTKNMDPVPTTGTIIIIKDTVPNDGQDFEFFTSGGLTPDSFFLDDDADATLSNSQTFTSVPAGSYSVGEAVDNGIPAPNYEISSIVCDDPTSDSFTSIPSAFIELAAGETVTCTFTNTFIEPEPEPATVTVIKQVVGAGADADLEFDFFVNSSDATALPQESFKLSANSAAKVFTNLPALTRVTVEEFFIPANYELTDMTCESDSAASILNFSKRLDPGINGIAGIVDFQVRAGENITCTFTNRLIRADLEVKILESDFSLAPEQYFVAPEYINNGSGTAENAVLTVTLPTGIVFVGVTGCNNTPVVTANQFTCELGDIAAEANGFIDIEFFLDNPSLTAVVFSAEISSDTLDIVPENNTDSNSFVLPDPELIECSIPGELNLIMEPPFNVFRLSFFDNFGCSPEATIDETYSATLTVGAAIFSGTANPDGTFDFTVPSFIDSNTASLELQGMTSGGAPVIIQVNPLGVFDPR